MPEPSLPSAIVCVSAQEGTGLEALSAALQPLLPEADFESPVMQQPAADDVPEEEWGWSSSF